VLITALTTRQAVWTSPGQVASLRAYNPGASGAWLQLYALTSANTTVGSSTRWDVAYIPPGATLTEQHLRCPAFSPALTAAATTTRDGAVAASTGLECTFNIGGA
jgi:hypothetical protein